MSEFKKRSAANTPVPETTAPDAFADNDWNEEDFEQKINMSLNKKLKNTTDPQWNEMLETFNSESTDKDADFADIPQNVNASDDDYTVQPVAKTDAFSDGTDDNIFSDDFDDPPEEKPSEDESNGDFSDDFDDNFDDASSTALEVRRLLQIVRISNKDRGSAPFDFDAGFLCVAA